MSSAQSLAWHAAARAAGGAASLPCLALDAVDVSVRVRHICSSWFGRQPQAVSPAPQAIEVILDDLGTGGWRIRRDAARAVAHVYCAGRPQGVLEFGSGVSTVVFAALAQTCGLPTRIVSIEESPDYAEETRRLLRRYGFADRATVVVAPVEEQTLDGWRGFTYRPDERILADALGGVRPDLVFIDGPASWLRQRRDCRFGTLLVARQWAAERAYFIADDAFRRRERAILKRWRALDGVQVFGIVPVGRGLGLGALVARAT